MARHLVVKCLYRVCVALWLMIVLASTARPAYAYVDPGTGLLLFQVVGSTFAGIMFLLRKHLRQFFGRFSRHSTREAGDVGDR